MAMKKCPVCGEKYSDTYRSCPFCEEEKNFRRGKSPKRKGGHRVSQGGPSLLSPMLVIAIVLMAALLRSEGCTVFVENIFENRYRHVDELSRMGAEIRVAGRVAVVNGVRTLHGAAVKCTDLRGGAALVIAGLSAEGTTRVTELTHIDRGYDAIERDLAALGAQIRRETT